MFTTIWKTSTERKKSFGIWFSSRFMRHAGGHLNIKREEGFFNIGSPVWSETCPCFGQFQIMHLCDSNTCYKKKLPCISKSGPEWENLYLLLCCGQPDVQQSTVRGEEKKKEVKIELNKHNMKTIMWMFF